MPIPEPTTEEEIVAYDTYEVTYFYRWTHARQNTPDTYSKLVTIKQPRSGLQGMLTNPNIHIVNVIACSPAKYVTHGDLIIAQDPA